MLIDWLASWTPKLADATKTIGVASNQPTSEASCLQPRPPTKPTTSRETLGQQKQSHPSTEQPKNQHNEQPTNRPTNPLTERRVEQANDDPTNQPTKQTTRRPTKPNNKLAGRLIDWLAS